MDYEQIEVKDGVRFSWNVWPIARLEANKLVVPISCLYTPLKELSTPVLPYEPVICKFSPCRGILNPFSQVDLNNKSWNCPICLGRNQLPTAYHGMTINHLPAELTAEYTTVEYKLARAPANPPIFIFLVDTTIEEEELIAMRESLLVTLGSLPPRSMVGLVTFGTMVQVHELGFVDIPKSYVFRGSKDYTQQQIQEMLGLIPSAGASARASAAHLSPSQASAHRFILPAEMCALNLGQIFEQLQRDPWPVDADKRPLRATGAAISIIVSLLETLYPQSAARLMLFVGGPCTVGPGMVVGPELKDPIRSHHDIDADRAKYYKKACNFYETLAKRSATNGYSVDILTGCLDQVGMAEMKSLSNFTGGNMILAESFATNMFKQSCQRIFLKDANGNLQMAFNATFDVQVSKELRICGLIGPAISMEKRNASCSDTEIGLGSTHLWKMCMLTPRTTQALYFEIVGTGPASPNSQAVVQFSTQYQHASGELRLRVTTVARSLVDSPNEFISAGFDQEAAAVLIGRIAVYKAEVDDSPDVMRWLDRLLIRLCQRYGDYRKDDPSSFRLSDQFSLYPQFMFHLRRSQFLHLFNNSPDESAFYRHVMNRENINNSLIMIQPTLTCYSLDQPPHPVLLDSASVRPDAILLLDSFFHIVIFHGEHIAAWRDQRLHEQPQYQALGQLLSVPHDDAKELLSDRYPIPMYVCCDQHGSQSRFLISKLNPSTTHVHSYAGQTSGQTPTQGQPIFTDDVSLQVFVDHLKKLVCSATSAQ